MAYTHGLNPWPIPMAYLWDPFLCPPVLLCPLVVFLGGFGIVSGSLLDCFGIVWGILWGRRSFPFRSRSALSSPNLLSSFSWLHRYCILAGIPAGIPANMQYRCSQLKLDRRLGEERADLERKGKDRRPQRIPQTIPKQSKSDPETIPKPPKNTTKGHRSTGGQRKGSHR